MSRNLPRAAVLLLVLCSAQTAMAAIPSPERGALIDLYTQTDGANWNDSTGWLGTAGTECSWYGVTCNDAETAVVGIGLNGNHLAGSLPSSLGNLGSLRYLDLSENEIGGSIPTSLGSLANIEELALSNNRITGTIPTSLGNLSHLVYLALHVNELDGAIPSSLGNLTNLEQLHLYENRLNGTIPSQLGQLVNATIITLGYNRLTGSIPAALSGLTRIELLDLGANQLNGSIPSALGSLTTMTELRLDENRLTGSIPSALAGATSLERLLLASNRLDGTIPPELSTLSQLREIDISGNLIGGSIPSEIGSLGSLTTLLAESNQLSGPIPAVFGNLMNLEYLSLGNNQLTGPIPPELGSLSSLVVLSLWGNQLKGGIPAELGDVATLREITLGGNMLDGTIPASLANLSALETLDLDNNQLTGSIPAALGNLSNLEYFNLAGNRLTGTIPSSLSALSALRGFLVYGNQLTGTIPTWFTSFPDLEELLVGGNLLTGTIPDNITTLTKLTYLDTCGNFLTGPIPSGIGNLVNLEYLSLCEDDLSGPIPSGLWTLTKLIDVRLDDNEFTGALPPEVGNLVNAEVLLLGYNHLEGAIPARIADLSKITVLALDGNRFTGAIPPEIGEMTTLEFLGLSDNNLVGAIPTALSNLVNLEDGQGMRLGYNALTTTSSSLRSFLDQKHDEDGWVSTQTVAPTNLSISDVTDRSFIVHLTPIEYIYDEGGYEITVAAATQLGDSTFETIVTTSSKEATSIIVRGLEPSTTYGAEARSVTYPHGYQQNLVRSESTAAVTATTGARVIAPASVDMTTPPAGLVQIGGVPQNETSFTLTNFGDVATTITLDQSDAFFTQSPSPFVLGPGASQVVTVSSVPNQPPESYWGAAIPHGDGVPEDLAITIQLLSVSAPSGRVVAVPLASRVDVAGAPGTDSIGTVSFRNTGTADLAGILVSDVDWIETPVDLIEIPHGEVRAVNFTVRRSKRPDAVFAEGALSTTLRLVYLDGSGLSSLSDLHANAAPVGVTQTLVTVVDTSKPQVSASAIPSIGSGEVALAVPGVVGSATQVSDLLITNAFGSGTIPSLQVYFQPTGLTPSSVAPVGGLAPSQSLALAGVVGSVFGSTSSGSVFVRATSWGSLRVAASLVDLENPSGPFSATLPVFRSDRAIAPGGEIDLPGAVDAAYSTTLFVQEMSGAAVRASIDPYDDDGNLVGTPIDLGDLGPFGLGSTSSLPAGAKSLVVRNSEESSGNIVAYARLRDASSDDIWSIGDWRRMAGLSSTTVMRVPLVLREVEPTGRRRPVRRPLTSGSDAGTATAAESGSTLRTTVAIFNPGSEATRVDLRYRESSTDYSRTMTIGGHETLTVDDVATTMIGRRVASTGSLEITPVGGPVAVSARLTGTAGAGGTRGAAIPLVSATSGLRLGQSQIFSGLDDVRQATFASGVAGSSRTSFGFTETAGSALTIRASVLVFDGRALAGTTVSRDFDIDPRETIVMHDMLRSIIGTSRELIFGDLRNLQLELRVIDGEGAVIPFVIATDSASGDLRFRLE